MRFKVPLRLIFRLSDATWFGRQAISAGSSEIMVFIRTQHLVTSPKMVIFRLIIFHFIFLCLINSPHKYVYLGFLMSELLTFFLWLLSHHPHATFIQKTET